MLDVSIKLIPDNFTHKVFGVFEIVVLFSWF